MIEQGSSRGSEPRAGPRRFRGVEGRVLNSLGDFERDPLDVGLPGLSGLQVLAYLKRDRQLRDVPVVVATSDGDLETRCREAGCAAWIAKPFGANELLRALTTVVGSGDEHTSARPS